MTRGRAIRRVPANSITMAHALCVCGGLPEEHVILLGHPDRTTECYHDDECECGQYRAVLLEWGR